MALLVSIDSERNPLFLNKSGILFDMEITTQSMLTIFFILIHLELEVIDVCAGGSNGIFEVMKKAIQYNIFHNIFPSIKNESTCLGYEERCPELLAGKDGDLSTKEFKHVI